MKNLIIKFDILTLSPKLKINKQASYNTLVGGIFTIILLILSFLGVIYFGQELWFKNEPIAIVSVKENISVGPYVVNEDTAYVYFAVEFSNYTYFNNPRIYEFSAAHEVIRLDNNGEQIYSKTNIDIKTCDNYFTKEKLLSLGVNIDLNINHCLEPNKSYVEGFWGNKVNSYIRVILSKCTNTTENNNHCFPEEEINSLLQGGIIGLYTKNNIYDLNSYQTPMSRQYLDIYNSLNIDFTFSLFLALRPLEFTSDSGLILRNIETINTFYIENPFILYYGKRGKVLADIVLQGKALGQKVSRSYLKFQDALTKIGGLIKALTLIGAYIVNYSSTVEFYIDYIFNIGFKEYKLSKFNDSIRVKATLLNNFIDKNNKPEKSKKPIFSKLTPGLISVEFPSKEVNNEDLPSKDNINKNLSLGIKQPSINNTPNAFVLKTGNILEKKNTNLINSMKSYSINETNKIYDTSQKLKDYFTVMFWCFNHNPIVKIKENIERKLNASFSIDILIEKIYNLEAILKLCLSDQQEILLNTNFPKYMKEDCKEESNNSVFHIIPEDFK